MIIPTQYRRPLRWMVAAVVVIGLLVAGFVLISKKKQALAETPRFQLPDTLVETATVQRGDLDEAFEYLAVVEPIQTANVTARVTARIESVNVDEGSAVEPGQTLLTLDHREIRAQLKGVEARIQQARAELKGNQATVTSLENSLAYWSREAERDTELAAGDAIPPSRAEQTAERKSDAEGKLNATRQQSNAIRERIHSLEAQREELETVLSYCVIKSRFVGTVTSRLVDPGDQAAPGKVLLVIESSDAMRIAFDVPQNDLADIEPGLPVRFRAGDKTREAAITRLYPALNRARMARAEIILSGDQSSGLTSGEYLTARVAYRQNRNVSLIPVGALIEDRAGRGEGEGEVRVFVVKDGALQSRRVNILGTANDRAAVTGLDAGEQVVVHSFLGWARLHEGMEVASRP